MASGLGALDEPFFTGGAAGAGEGGGVGADGEFNQARWNRPWEVSFISFESFSEVIIFTVKGDLLQFPLNEGENSLVFV